MFQPALSRVALIAWTLAGSDALAHAQRASPRALYELTILPGSGTTPESVNRSGAVAGYGGFVWTRAAGLVQLAPLAGWSWSMAEDIDDHGVVVGHSAAGSSYLATQWSASGAPQAIVVPGVQGSSATALNNAGLIVGTSNLGNWAWDATSGARLLAPLGLPSDCYVTDVNGSGQMVGGQPYSHAWRFDLSASSLTYLGTLGGLYSHANGVNDRGHVVGQSMTAFGYYEYAPFLWTPEEGMRWLGTLEPGWTFLFQGGANSVNDDDVVVGSMRVQGGRTHAFLWDRAYGMRDLNELVRQRGPYELQNAVSISDTGWITGRALDTSSNDAPVGFVLRPR